MSDLKKEMLRIKVKGYFDNGDLKVDPAITAFVKYHVEYQVSPDANTN